MREALTSRKSILEGAGAPSPPLRGLRGLRGESIRDQAGAAGGGAAGAMGLARGVQAGVGSGSRV